MSTTGIGFRWLDILEKEFDKAYVELDTSIAEIDADDPEIAFAVRQKMATLSSCFAQLSHKAQTIFQNSAKVDAELVDLRTRLVDVQALVEPSRRHITHDESAVAAADRDSCSGARVRAECAQLARENAALRDTVLMLHGDLYGARLAAKYLDKELAGRIQQLQLLGREMRGAVRDRLWRQLEAEILLQRHKNVVRACRLANTLGGARPAAGGGRGAPVGGAGGQRGVGEPRVVLVKRTPHQGLGISITGGREHGVPILISELEAGGPAAATGALYVGDAILAVNQVDLRQSCHREAVHALQAATGDCALAVQFVADDDSDDETQHSYSTHYPLFPLEDATGEVTVTPTAPRTPLHSPTSHRRQTWDSRSEEYSDFAERLSPEMSSDPRVDLAYLDYSGLHRGRHPILDMDDNNIKIETDVDSPLINLQNCYQYGYSKDETDKTNQEEKDENCNGSTNFSAENSNSSESPSKQKKFVEKVKIFAANTNSVSSETTMSVDVVGSKLYGQRENSPDNGEKLEKTNKEKTQNKIFPKDSYDQNSERNQNIGYLYPKLGLLQNFGLGKYQGLIPDYYNNVEISSSNDNSLENTPVHRRSRAPAHRNKPGDWKSKGAYRPVQHTSTDADTPTSSPLRDIKIDRSYRRDSAAQKGGVKTLQHIFGNRVDVDPSDINSDDEQNINLLPNSQLTVKNGVRENSFKYVEPILVNKLDFNVKSPNIDTINSTSKSSINDHVKELEKQPDETRNDTDSEIKTAQELCSSSYASDGNKLSNSDRDFQSGRLKISNDTSKTVPAANAQSSVRSRAFRIGSAKRIPPPPDFVHIPLKNVLDDESSSSTTIGRALETSIDDIELIKFEPENKDLSSNIQNINGRELSNLIYKSLNSEKDICMDDSLKQALSRLEMSVGGGGVSHATAHTSHAFINTSHLSYLVQGDGDPQFGTPV